MGEQLNTWAPTLKGNEDPTYSLMVECGTEPPTEETYRSFLFQTLTRLIQQDPKQAREDLQMVSPPHSPTLSHVLVLFEPREWATQIMLSPPMGMLLNRIDWQKMNPVEKSSPDELPDLIQIIEMLA